MEGKDNMAGPEVWTGGPPYPQSSVHPQGDQPHVIGGQPYPQSAVHPQGDQPHMIGGQPYPQSSVHPQGDHPHVIVVDGQPITMAPVIEDRDPTGVNAHVKIRFVDVIAEPPGLHSSNCTYSCHRCCYECTKGCTYTVATFLCGWLLSICWGSCFVGLACWQIWVATPCYRVMEISCHTFYRCNRLCTQCCTQPMCEAYSYCLSNIRVFHSKEADQ